MRPAIRPSRRHGLIAVRCSDDSLGFVEVRTVDSSMVAGAVDALVCRARRPGQRCGVRHPSQELVGHERVGLDPVPFVACEGSGLVPDRVRNGDTTEVVHQGCGLGRGSTHLQCESGDGPRVAARPRRLEVGEVGEDKQRIVRRSIAERWTRRGYRERCVPGVDRLDRVPPAPSLLEDEIREIRVLARLFLTISSARAIPSTRASTSSS